MAIAEPCVGVHQTRAPDEVQKGNNHREKVENARRDADRGAIRIDLPSAAHAVSVGAVDEKGFEHPVRNVDKGGHSPCARQVQRGGDEHTF